MLPVRLSSLFISISLLTACSGFRPDDIGIIDDMLVPCPSSPNCVSSYANDETHYIAPLKLKNSMTPEQVVLKVKEALAKLPRIEVIKQSDIYVYAEATTKIMQFVDDVEFLIDSDNNQIHVRSASRLGYRDFSANRERVEAIRALLIEDGMVIPSP